MRKTTNDKIAKDTSINKTDRSYLSEEEIYLAELREKIIKDVEEKKATTRVQANIAINNDEECMEIKIKKNEYTLVPEGIGFKFYSGESKSYIIADKDNIRITYKKIFFYIEKNKGMYYIITNNENVVLTSEIKGFSKENDVIAFYIDNLVEVVCQDKKLSVKHKREKEENKIDDNDTLVISQKDGKVYLPYKISELEQNEFLNKYYTIEDLIEEKYILPISKYHNSIKARYVEAYKLMKYREKKSSISAILFRNRINV